MDWSSFLELVGLGFVAGTWGTLIGAGGGFIMVPVLLFFARDLSAAQVTALSLLAVFANGVSGTVTYGRLGRIDYRSGVLFLVATLPGGILGALAVNYIARGPFQVIFGALLSLAATYVFLRPARPNKAPAPTGLQNANRRRIVDSNRAVYQYTVKLKLGLAINFGVGFLASMLGVGGGIFNVPSFVYLIGMPLQVATATSQFMLVGTSLVANVTNMLEGDLWGLWTKGLALAMGTVAGAQAGARLSQRISSRWISRALAAGLLAVGAGLVYNGVRASLA